MYVVVETIWPIFFLMVFNDNPRSNRILGFCIFSKRLAIQCIHFMRTRIFLVGEQKSRRRVFEAPEPLSRFFAAKMAFKKEGNCHN